MFLIASAAASPLVTIFIALVGGGGLAGGIVSLLKLRPEASSAAVSQAQGAMEMMQKLNDELSQALAGTRAELMTMRATCREQEELIMQMRQIVRGMAMMEEKDS